MGLASKHKKRLWYTAAVGGVAGLTGLAGINYVARVASPDHRSESPAAAAAAPQVARPMADAKNNKDKNKNKSSSTKASDSKGSGKDATGDYGDNSDSSSYSDKVVNVPCDAEELFDAIGRAIIEGGATLKLEEHCTYSLANEVEGAGLPLITVPITIKGNDATIQRAAGEDVPDFRIFDVETGGNLKLSDLTVKYGVAADGDGGGGLLVRLGGRATLEDTTFAFNRSEDEGGAIANFGITKIAGEQKDGVDMNKDGVYPTDPKDNSDSGADPSGKDDPYGHWSNDSWTKDQSDGSSESWSNDGGDWNSLITRNSAREGGGIYNARYLTVEHTRVSYNDAVGPGGPNAEGGGLLTDEGGVSQLRYVSIDHNRAEGEGAGVDNDGGSTTTLAYSYVANNTTAGDGGGIDNEAQGQDVSSLFLSYTSVSNNEADRNGGGINNEGALVAEYSQINGNTAHRNGGGLYNNGNDANAVLRHSEVNLNRAIGTAPPSEGGGIWNGNNSELHLTATDVKKNLSVEPAGGIENNNMDVGTEVTVDDNSSITKNRPTNCEGSARPVPNCFG